MRAGLLSNPRVIGLLNENFVCTWSIATDLMRNKDGKLEKTLLDNCKEYPYVAVNFLFLDHQGQFVSKQKSYKDYTQVHPDVVVPLRLSSEPNRTPHVDVFLRHVAEKFGIRPTQPESL